jgi:hypothetical protein
MKKVCYAIFIVTMLSLRSFGVLPTAAYSYRFGMLETFDSMGTSTNAPMLNGQTLWNVCANGVEFAQNLIVSTNDTWGGVTKGFNAGTSADRMLAFGKTGGVAENSFLIASFSNETGKDLTEIELYYDLECCWIRANSLPFRSAELVASMSTNGVTWSRLPALDATVNNTNANQATTWLSDDEMDRQSLSKRNIGGIISLSGTVAPIQPGQKFYIRWATTTASSCKNMTYGIDELRAGPKDSDRDGMPDVWEVANDLNDASADADSDGLTNLQEYQRGTNPKLADTDGDGMPDGWEVANGLNPLVNDASADADSDGLTNLQEYQRGTNPGLADSDGDGQSDGEEVTKGTNPLDPTSFTIVMTSGSTLTTGLEKNVVKWPKAEGKYYTLLFSETVTGTFTPVPGCVRLTKPIGLDAGCAHVTSSETGFYKVLVETN